MGIMSNDIFDLLSLISRKLLYLLLFFQLSEKSWNPSQSFGRENSLKLKTNSKMCIQLLKRLQLALKVKPGRQRRRRRKKKAQTNQEKECPDYANYNLSCYAASLSKEFVIKVSFLPSSLLFFPSVRGLLMRDVLCMHVCWACTCFSYDQ